MTSSKLAWHWKQDFWNAYYFKHPILYLLLIVYTLFGAMIFVILERPAQIEMERLWNYNLRELRSETFRNLTEALFNTTQLIIYLDPERSEQARDIVRTALLSYESNMFDLFETKVEQSLQWDMWNASVFALSCYTTIGYRNMYPITWRGKLALMLYSTMGIPILLSVLSSMAFLIHTWLKEIIKLTCLRMRSREFGFIEIPTTLPLLLMILWIFSSSAVCMLWNRDWSYFDSFYFNFHTFSTIGMAGIDEMSAEFYFVAWFFALVTLALISLYFQLLMTKTKRFQSLMTDSARSYATNPIFIDNMSLSLTNSKNSLDKPTYDSYVTENDYGVQTKLLFSNHSNSLKSMDTINLLMGAYKDELAWLAESGKFHSEEQSLVEMTVNEEVYEAEASRTEDEKTISC